MGIVAVLVLTFGFVAIAHGIKCGDISGTWQNELGSRMILGVDDSNRIYGEYYTAVEKNPGAAAFVSNVTGLFSRQGDGSLLAFSVLFNHGSSLTSWVGQCMVCEEKEVLHTTYTFREYMSNHHEKWSSIVVNQNTFWRPDELAENTIEDSVATTFFPIRTLSVVSQKPPGGLNLKGKWKSSDNEELEIFGANEYVLEGKRHTTDVIGRKDGNDVYTAVALMSTSSKKMRAWTGYSYTTSAAVPHTLETSWLEHEFNPSCLTARNMVRFGTQNFVHMAAGSENIVNKSETFFDKIRKFFTTMF